MLSDFDRANIGAILAGEGTWFTAHLLRALDDLLPRADATNRARIEATWPDECAALAAYHNGTAECVHCATVTPLGSTHLCPSDGKAHFADGEVA